MSIGKDKLNFDASSANTLAASDTIGSYTLDGSGTQITSTAGSGAFAGKQGLDVSIISPVSIDVVLNGIYDAGTNPTPDNVGLIGFTRTATPGLAQQTFTWTGGAASSDAVVAANVHSMDVNAFGMGYNGTTWDRLKATSGMLNVSDGGGSLTVDAVDLDIRDLAFATDKVDVSGSSVSITGTVAVTQSTSPWVVSATDLDIRDLAAATDSVSAWTKDGSGNAITSTTGWLDVNVAGSTGTFTVSDAALANTAIKSTATGATTTAAVLVASALAARKYLTLQNLGGSAVFFGDASVTASTGLRLSNGAMLEGLRIGPAIAPKVLTSAGTADVRVMELS